jgi:hypothetical protein
MQESIFPTKVKAILFVLTVVLVAMAGSLHLDAVKGVLPGRKLRVWIYLEGSNVEGTLTEGNMVTAYRRSVGQIDQVSLFTAEVLRQSEIGKINLGGLAGTPERLARLKTLQKDLAFQPVLVTGVKLRAMLYENLIGPMMPLFGPRSEARVVSAGMLGEPYLQIYPMCEGGGIKDGDNLSFPKNDVTSGPKTVPTYGIELMMPGDVVAAQKRIKVYRVRAAEFEHLLNQQ